METCRVALIGLGPHARRIYYPYLEQVVKAKSTIEFSLLIDIDSQKDGIESFISQRNIAPKEVLYLNRVEASFEDEAPTRLINAFKRHNITHVIVATEPKAHKKYIQFAVEADLKVLTDKPITSPTGLTPSKDDSPEEALLKAQQIIIDVEDILSQVKKHPDSSVTVQTQRRYHKGYRYIFSLLGEVVNEYKIPITYIDIFHSDGMWNMPEEFATRENHPYKYGYGKLMHSGYHFVDLMQQLIKINEGINSKIADTVEVYSRTLHPEDHYAQFNKQDYEHLFRRQSKKFELLPNPTDGFLNTYGELDTFSQWSFRKEGKTITTVNMDLMQSGYSLRAWSELPEDTYKANGRVRHERINIHVGPLMNIQVHSYQSVEVGDPSSPQGVGSKQHFDIYIFRNTQLIGGDAFRHIRYGDNDIQNEENSIYLGQNEQPRFEALNEFFFSKKTSVSNIESHLTTNRLMSVLYSNQGKQTRGETPYASYNYKELF